MNMDEFAVRSQTLAVEQKRIGERTRPRVHISAPSPKRPDGKGASKIA